MILLPDLTAEPELMEPKQSVAFGCFGVFLEDAQTTASSTKWKSSELLLSCKAINAEVAHVLLSHNAFLFTCLRHLSEFRLYQGPSWHYLRFLHLDLILGPSVDIPGVVDRAAWRALWTMISRESTGLLVLDVDIHVPMNHTVERWLPYRGQGWRARDRFFQSLPDWADDLKVLRGIRDVRFEDFSSSPKLAELINAERLSEVIAIIEATLSTKIDRAAGVAAAAIWSKEFPVPLVKVTSRLEGRRLNFLLKGDTGCLARHVISLWIIGTNRKELLPSTPRDRC
jgi:hypothetical protein